MYKNRISALSSNSKQAGIESVTGTLYSVGVSDFRYLVSNGIGIENYSSEELLSKHLKIKFASEADKAFVNYLNRKPNDTSRILLSEISIGISENQKRELFCIEGNLFEVVIAPFFGPFAVSQAAKHSVILVPQPIEKIKLLKEAHQSQRDLKVEVNLKHQTVCMAGIDEFQFETDPWLRAKLLQGLDNMDELQLNSGKFRSHLDKNRYMQPWLYENEAHINDEN